MFGGFGSRFAKFGTGGGGRSIASPADLLQLFKSNSTPNPGSGYETVPLPYDFPVVVYRDATTFGVQESGSSFLSPYTGSTIYVSPAGDDGSGDGSGSLPYQSLDTAIANAVNNDVISMAAGIYAMPSSSVSKNLAFTCPTGNAYIGSFNDLSTAVIDEVLSNGQTVYNVGDVNPGETFRGYLRTDGVLVSDVSGSAIGTTNSRTTDYQEKGIMSVYAGSSSANFATGTSESLIDLVAAGSVLAWTDADTDGFIVADGTNVYIGENITLASYATKTIECLGSSELVLNGCEVYGGTSSTISHPGTGRVTIFDTIVAGSGGDNIDYREDVIATEVNVTSCWCGDSESDNASTGHNDVKVLRVGGTYRGGSRTVHDVQRTKAFVYSCTIGDALYNDKALLLSGFSTIANEQTTLSYGDINFIDTFNDGSLTNLLIDSESISSEQKLSGYGRSVVDSLSNTTDIEFANVNALSYLSGGSDYIIMPSSFNFEMTKQYSVQMTFQPTAVNNTCFFASSTDSSSRFAISTAANNASKIVVTARGASTTTVEAPFPSGTIKLYAFWDGDSILTASYVDESGATVRFTPSAEAGVSSSTARTTLNARSSLSAEATAKYSIFSVEKDNALLGTYPLQEGSGSTAYDVSGNGNHLTITSPSWSTLDSINSWNHDYGFTDDSGVYVPGLESGASDAAGNPIGNPPALDNDSEAALIQTDSVFTSGTVSEWSADGATMDEVTFDQLVVHGTTNNGHDRLWVKVVDDIVVCIAQYNLDKNFTVTETLKNERYFGGTSAGLRDVNGDLITDSNGFVIFT